MKLAAFRPVQHVYVRTLHDCQKAEDKLVLQLELTHLSPHDVKIARQSKDHLPVLAK